MGSSQRQGKRHSGTSESPGDAEMAGSLRERVYQIGIDGLMMVLERSKQAETLRALSPSVGPMMAELTRLAVKGTVTKFQAICAAVLGVTMFSAAASAGGIVGVLVAVRSLKRYARNSKYLQ